MRRYVRQVLPHELRARIQQCLAVKLVKCLAGDAAFCFRREDGSCDAGGESGEGDDVYRLSAATQTHPIGVGGWAAVPAEKGTTELSGVYWRASSTSTGGSRDFPRGR